MLFDLLVEELSSPAVAHQPSAVANALQRSGLPPQLSVYPFNMAERYPHAMLRIHYVGGTFAQRRTAFASYAELLLDQSAILKSFLQPSISTNQCVDAYLHMVQRIFSSVQAPPDQTIFHLRTALDLASHLSLMPEIPIASDQLNPRGDAAQRSQAAVVEWDRRRAVNNTAHSSGSTDSGNGTQVAASKTLRQQLTSTLMKLAFFGQVDADIIRLHAANPSNDFPIIKRALETRNVIFFQVVVGRLKGVNDVSPGFKVLEGASLSFLKYADYITVMEKAPSPNPGTRPAHTIEYSREDFTKDFLSNNKEKFLKLKVLELCNQIKSMREQVVKQKLTIGDNLFESAESIPLLRYFSHFLDIFEFDHTGPGSWDDGLNRLEQFRQNGLSMPGKSRSFHFENCMKAYNLLLSDLFDSVSQFAQNREAPNVSLSLSSRVFEAGGSFELHLTFQNTTTSDLNKFIMLNPAFEKVLGGPSTSQEHEIDKRGKGGKMLQNKGTFKWLPGAKLLFGKGNGGPRYDTKACFKEIVKVQPGANQGNFCMLQFLSTKKGQCKKEDHLKGGQHTFSDAVLAIRDKLEYKPFRLDSKAKS